MKRQLTTHAAAAAMIRAELKKHGISAKVTSEAYSMGTSIRVHIKQDLMPAARKEIESFAHRFQYGHFDGMTDSYEYNNRIDGLPQAKFVFVEVHYSDEIKADARAYIETIRSIEPHEVDRYAHMALIGYWGDFWTARKPHVRLAA